MFDRLFDCANTTPTQEATYTCHLHQTWTGSGWSAYVPRGRYFGSWPCHPDRPDAPRSAAAEAWIVDHQRFRVVDWCRKAPNTCNQQLWLWDYMNIYIYILISDIVIYLWSFCRQMFWVTVSPWFMCINWNPVSFMPTNQEIYRDLMRLRY